MTKMSPDDRYKNMDEVVRDILALNEVSKTDPMKDFVNGAIAVGTVVGIAFVLAKLFEKK